MNIFVLNWSVCVFVCCTRLNNRIHTEFRAAIFQHIRSNDNNSFSGLTSLVQPTIDLNSNNIESERLSVKAEKCNSCQDKQFNLEQNHIVRNPWTYGFEDDYDDPNS
jgi:hypothetical protein